MYRRRRRPEPAALFSFDSFMDVVANVIGIVLRLILVAWVGSRLYKGPPPPLPPSPTEVQVAAFVPPPEDDKLGRELARQNEELARTRQLALEELRSWEGTRRQREQAEAQATALRQQREQLERSQPDFSTTLTAQKQSAEKTALSLDQVRQRHEKLKSELEAIQKAPRATKQLAYRLPLSAAVQTEEIFFELRKDRVTVIDVAAMLDDVKVTLRQKGQQLKSTWQVEETTPPVGAFRLRYTLERERGLLEGGPPNPDSGFSYGLSRWQVEGILEERGETAEQALKPGSAFRKVIDALDSRQVVVTLWVYPDSFALYRALRDHLHDRELVVAGRPLPDGRPIASSRRGSISRGQ